MSLRVRAATLLVALLAVAGGQACRGGLFGKEYEYEEDLYLSTNASATLIINTSVAALVALRGLDLEVDGTGRPNPDRIRAAYESSNTHVTRVSRPWSRDRRRFVQIRINVNDVRQLSSTGPLSWSRYAFLEEDQERVFRQTVGASALRAGTLQNVGWTGGELVAFRIHLPSRILYHNARDIETNRSSDVQRGNIVAWEQLLTDRLDGRPLAIEVRMDRQSILHTTLWLFAGAFAAAVLLLGALIWLTFRKGAKEAATAP
jgi:hypothetical protein